MVYASSLEAVIRHYIFRSHGIDLAWFFNFLRNLDIVFIDVVIKITEKDTNGLLLIHISYLIYPFFEARTKVTKAFISSR